MTDETINSNLKKRIISALVMLPIAIFFIYVGGWLFNVLLISAAMVMAYEWHMMVSLSEKTIEDEDKYTVWMIAGGAYVAIPLASLISLRVDADGFLLVLWVFSVVWATDICAYFVGKKIGGPKLAPKISPKKTWSGLVGGVIGALCVGAVAAFFADDFSIRLVIFSGSLAVIAQLGDLGESMLKRYFDVKDSGSIIPGHGGLLDRVDGLVPVVPLVLVVHSLKGLF